MAKANNGSPSQPLKVPMPAVVASKMPSFRDAELFVPLNWRHKYNVKTANNVGMAVCCDESWALVAKSQTLRVHVQE
ncbi:MAG: hypothetical protein Q9217_000130 [Psora testacea]